MFSTIVIMLVDNSGKRSYPFELQSDNLSYGNQIDVHVVVVTLYIKIWKTKLIVLSYILIFNTKKG